MSAINDGVLLKCHVQAIIKRYFKEKLYFMDLMELWNEVKSTPTRGHARMTKYTNSF